MQVICNLSREPCENCREWAKRSHVISAILGSVAQAFAGYSETNSFISLEFFSVHVFRVSFQRYSHVTLT